MSGPWRTFFMGALLGSVLTQFWAIGPILNKLSLQEHDSTSMRSSTTTMSLSSLSSSSSSLRINAPPVIECSKTAEQQQQQDQQQQGDLIVEISEDPRPQVIQGILFSDATTQQQHQNDDSHSSLYPESSTDTTTTTKTTTVVQSPIVRTGFCHNLPPTVTATHLWKSHKERILKASKTMLGNKEVHDLSFPIWLERLFDLLHTRFLRLGYRNPPLPAPLRQVLNILQRRIDFLKKNPNHRQRHANSSYHDDTNDTTHIPPPPPPPLHVVVVGGSVTQGRGSCKDPFGNQTTLNSRNMHCHWPGRLQQLFNEFLGPHVVIIENLSMGGTSTALSTTIVKYRLYPTQHLQLHGPDIIINAYSTNDALPTAANQTYDVEYHRNQREVAQAFIRASQESRGPCSDLPLIVYIDDYLGNQHNLILSETSNAWYTQEMSEWYGAMYISYASAVRRLVYANSQESLLSAYWPWWNDNDNNNHNKNNNHHHHHHSRSDPPKIQVHITMAAHMAISWVVAFATLSSVVNFCEDDYNEDGYRNNDDDDDNNDSSHTNDNGSTRSIMGHLFPDIFPPIVMEMMEHVMPPMLNATTTLERVSQEWVQQFRQNMMNPQCGMTTRRQRHHDDDDPYNKDPQLSSSSSSSSMNTRMNPCVLAFLCGPMGTVRNIRMLQEFVQQTTTGTTIGWKAQDDSGLVGGGWTNKLGYVAYKANATTTFYQNDTQTTVRSIQVYYLKSYGTKWMNSRAKFTFRGLKGNKILLQKSFILEGFHNSNTSIAYPYELDLDEEMLPKNVRIELTVQLISGTTFKLIGMVICNHP